ncbi:MAG: 50S ribosomal protein L21 [Candidatus Omnitrophica bacterium]|nr:50S ribosomal protein L21 [Candidatus Omnitrophota bacterium]
MWVVAKIGSKQYKIKEGDVIQVERLDRSSGSKITLGQVLVFHDDNKIDVGRPYIKDVKIEAKVLEEKKAKKVTVFKFKRRKDYQKKTGHRQIYTFLKVLKIKVK